ncbi:phage virion morphogenesis protein [Dietzia cinnamea]|uniref:phage virion morphogenesis protein n=1 Tax=Dietzia cinnamea TaxID=321318 RepID=UPI00223B6185|nr:phage virion morphogenesis protein [Dietzia cinnamea]MCT2077509.1 phage virion morphogenesis protein [Dietzia cinnamea]MCT2219806.1 phage virion morphogenesis protein [Dietzia cinnamea]
MASSDSSLSISMSLSNAVRVQKMLGELGLSLSDLKSGMEDVGTDAVKFFSNSVFASRGGAIGVTWPRLSTSYADAKAKKFPGRGVLVASGTMRKSFDSEASQMSVTISNRDPKFKYHQSSRARKRIPRRQMLGMSPQLQRRVTKTLAGSLAKKVREAQR